MRNLLLFLCGALLLSLCGTPASAQSRKYVIAVIGSSTAVGTGATPIDSSWVNLTKAYFKGLGDIDTIYNIALGGQTTYPGMPTGFVPPAGRPSPDTARNITKALSFNPDVVLVNFPTNDAAADYTLKETMTNLRAIYAAAVAAGKIAFITTSQPRTSLSTSQKQLLKTMRDSVNVEFGNNSLNFYDPIVAADSFNINPIYNFDGTHVNNAGHRVLFQVVKAKGILSGIIPLPLTLLSFSASTANGVVRLGWSFTDAAGPLQVVVQRSADGKDFADLARQTDQTAPGVAKASWTDDNPLPGKSWYRIQYSDTHLTGYSRIVEADMAAVAWGIGKVYMTGSSEMRAEIDNPVPQSATVSVFSQAGTLVFRQGYRLAAPAAVITIPAGRWASGAY